MSLECSVTIRLPAIASASTAPTGVALELGNSTSSASLRMEDYFSTNTKHENQLSGHLSENYEQLKHNVPYF